MGWIEEEKEANADAVRLTAASRAGRAECHPRKLDMSAVHERMLELELENLRLSRLVADLLVKNQQLRTSN